MSDLLAAAAAALGTPEAIVQRSAQARAEATGSSVDEILAAWAGGEAAPAPSPPVEAPPPAEPAATAEPEPAAPPAPPVIEVPSAALTPVVVAAAPAGKPPTLIGATDNPFTVLIGAVGLFIAVVLVGLVGPSIQTDNPGARTSEIAHTQAGEEGQQVYRSQGCSSCHTQMIRPIVADVGLGPVTLNDSNQIVGTRRFGPDLSDVGARFGADELADIIGGAGDHPPAGLSSADLDNLVTYLIESNPEVAG